MSFGYYRLVSINQSINQQVKEDKQFRFSNFAFCIGRIWTWHTKSCVQNRILFHTGASLPIDKKQLCPPAPPPPGSQDCQLSSSGPWWSTLPSLDRRELLSLICITKWSRSVSNRLIESQLGATPKRTELALLQEQAMICLWVLSVGDEAVWLSISQMGHDSSDT